MGWWRGGGRSRWGSIWRGSSAVRALLSVDCSVMSHSGRAPSQSWGGAKQRAASGPRHGNAGTERPTPLAHQPSSSPRANLLHIGPCVTCALPTPRSRASSRPPAAPSPAVLALTLSWPRSAPRTARTRPVTTSSQPHRCTLSVCAPLHHSTPLLVPPLPLPVPHPPPVPAWSGAGGGHQRSGCPPTERGAGEPPAWRAP